MNDLGELHPVQYLGCTGS